MLWFGQYTFPERTGKAIGGLGVYRDGMLILFVSLCLCQQYNLKYKGVTYTSVLEHVLSRSKKKIF